MRYYRVIVERDHAAEHIEELGIGKVVRESGISLERVQKIASYQAIATVEERDKLMSVLIKDSAIKVADKLAESIINK